LIGADTPPTGAGNKRVRGPQRRPALKIPETITTNAGNERTSMAQDQFRMHDTDRGKPRLRITKIVVRTVPDEEPDLSWLKTEYDAERHTITSSCRCTNDDVKHYGWKKVKQWIDEDNHRFNTHGVTWSCVGVEAVAIIDILLEAGPNGFAICQTVKSGGVWGIENDSDSDYLHEEGENELGQLRDILTALGVEQVEIDNALKGAKWEQ